MIEVLIAMGVMFSALTVLAYTMLSGLSAVGESRQRTEATALANQALEQIRALPASQLYMSVSDVSGDPQLVSCGSATCFNARTVPVANFGSTPAITPLLPHIAKFTALPGNTVYTVKSYVTLDPSDSTGHTLVATVIASWSSAEKGGVASSLQVESKVYNAQFNEAAPGVHTFMASANQGPGTITISGTVLGSSLVDVHLNMPTSAAALNGTTLPGSGTNVGASGSAAVAAGIAQSGVTAGGVSLLNTPAATATSAGSTGGSTVIAGQTNTQTPSVAGSLPGSLGLDLGAVTGSTSVGSTETASAEAVSAASGATGTVPAGSPTPPTNGLGFGQGTASQTGAVGANLNVSALGLSVLGIGLVNLVPTGNLTPDYSRVVQGGVAASPGLQTFNAAASQQFSELDLLTLTGALGAALFPGPLVKLTAFQQTASACANASGISGPCTPTTSQTDTGFISILGAAPVSITQLLNGTIPLSSLNTLLTGVNLNLGVTTLGVTGTGITLGSTESSGSVPSPLSINLVVQASLLGVSLLNVTINVALGSANASASFQ